MTNFDDRLRSRLSAEDAQFLKDVEAGESLFGQLGGTFTGPMKLWSGVAFLMGFAWFVGAAYCFYRIWHTSDPREIGLYLAGFVFFMVATGMIKTWFWLRMNHVAMLKELKRMELRLMRPRDQ
jgi:hypothetical protein